MREEDIQEGDRVAQLVFLDKTTYPVATADISLSEAFDYGERKDGGFGSTGKQ
jgi:dUTPase